MCGLVRCCDDCRFGVPAAASDGLLFFCRRYPPREHSWPLVDRMDWCGEWQAPPIGVTEPTIDERSFPPR